MCGGGGVCVYECTIEKFPKYPRGMDSGSSITLNAEPRKGVVVDIGSRSSESELNYSDISGYSEKILS